MVVFHKYRIDFSNHPTVTVRSNPKEALGNQRPASTMTLVRAFLEVAGTHLVKKKKTLLNDESDEAA